MADCDGHRLKGARPEFEEELVQQEEAGQDQRESKFKVCSGVSLTDVCVSLHESGQSDGHPGARVCLCSSGTHISLAHGSCGSWHMIGGSRCYTCYIQSWLCLQKASCRSTSPGPTSRHLRRQDTLLQSMIRHFTF